MNNTVAVNETKYVRVVYTNTDLTEGRGTEYPIAVCEIEATAIRLARKQYVMGSDCPIRIAKLVKIDGKWYAPGEAINIIKPTKEDEAAQGLIEAKEAAIKKAKAAGLSDDEIEALMR